VSVHRSPAATRSSSWRLRCSRRATTTTSGRGMTRREARVFGGWMRRQPSTHARVWRTDSRASSRSTASQVSPSSSRRRMPRTIAHRYSA
jgi:hypothetical protein